MSQKAFTVTAVGLLADKVRSCGYELKNVTSPTINLVYFAVEHQ